MLNISDDKYVRAYLYKINQKVVLDQGNFDINDKKRPGGGPSLHVKAFDIENNKWYDMKVCCINNNLTIKMKGKQVLQYSLNDLVQKAG